jgi:hypothetical protein
MKGDHVYKCEWCGRFYSSPLPDRSACDAHIPEHNERLSKSIKRFNAKLKSRATAEGDRP